MISLSLEVKSIRHAGIVVTDIEQSIDFYTNILGFKVQKDLNECGKYIDIFLGLDGVKVRTVKMSLNDSGMVELLHYQTHAENIDDTRRINSIGCSHLALTVNNLDSLYKKILDYGLSFISPPHKSPDGFVKVAFCRDPNGVYLELVEELK